MALTWPIDGTAVAKNMKWPEDRADELQDYADTAVDKIEEKVGPWHGQDLQHTVQLRTSATAILLPWPVASVEEVTADGTAVTPAAVDERAGIVYGRFSPGQVVMTVKARPAASTPKDVILGGLKLAKHLAKQDLVGPRGAGQSGSSDKDTDVQQGYALPRAVSELIADHVLSGFA